MRIFHSDDRESGRESQPGRSYVVLCSELMEKVNFSGSKTRLQFRAAPVVHVSLCLF